MELPAPKVESYPAGTKAPLMLSESIASGRFEDGTEFEVVRDLGGFDYQVRLNGSYHTIRMRAVIDAAIRAAVALGEKAPVDD
jgi:hypothetical protein